MSANVPSRQPWTKRRRVGVASPSPTETTRSCRYVTLIRRNISRGDQEERAGKGKGESSAARVGNGSVRKREKEEASVARRRRYRVAFRWSAARWHHHSIREALLGSAGSAPALATRSRLLRVGGVSSRRHAVLVA